MDKLDRHLEEVVKVTWNYAKKIKTMEGHWSNAALGLAGESGETADIIKKVLYHNVEDTLMGNLKLAKELGDVLYYWLRLVDFSGFTTDDIMAINREKLESRHPELGKVTERFGINAIR